MGQFNFRNYKTLSRCLCYFVFRQQCLRGPVPHVVPTSFFTLATGPSVQCNPSAGSICFSLTATRVQHHLLKSLLAVHVSSRKNFCSDISPLLWFLFYGVLRVLNISWVQVRYLFANASSCGFWRGNILSLNEVWFTDFLSILQFMFLELRNPCQTPSH
jgi:hypothetical protein